MPNGAPPNGPFTDLERAVRGKRYKLIRSLAGDELYDLLNDPWESVDLLLSPLTPSQQAAYAGLAAYLDTTVNSYRPARPPARLRLRFRRRVSSAPGDGESSWLDR